MNAVELDQLLALRDGWWPASRPVTKGAADAWLDELEDYPADTVKAAMRAEMTSGRSAPNLGDLVKGVRKATVEPAPTVPEPCTDAVRHPPGCEGEGVRHETRRSDVTGLPVPWAVACTCDLGRPWRKMGWPVWSIPAEPDKTVERHP